MYVEAERPATAAALYREAGLLSRAAEILHGAGEDLQAAECLLELSKLSSGGFTKEEADHFVRAAKTYKKKGQLANSACMLEAIREYGEAARRYLKAGERKRAARCYEAAGELEKAVELYRELEDQDATIRLLERMRRQGGGVGQEEYAQALKQAGQFERAADSYQAAGDFEAAVAANIEGDQPAGAAALLAEQGRHHESARMYLEAGDPAQAREQFLMAHDRRGAASAALAAGMFYEAGVDFVDLGQWGRAVEALQQLEDNHPRYREASSLLGQAFARLGERQMAWSMHQRAVAGLAMERDNLDLFYQMARFLEESPEVSERTKAQKLYSGIMVVNYTFRDAKARHDRLP
jgi:tetratricopeptide (TPR) repeat protein